MSDYKKLSKTIFTEFSAAYSRTNLKNMKFRVKGGESELLGIDLKKVSLKRKIQNDDSTTQVTFFKLKIDALY